jgi:hypothetical protein
MKPVAQRNGSAGPLRLFCQSLDQSAPLDNQVRMFQGNIRATPIREQFEAPDLVDDASLRSRAKQVPHPMRYDKRPRCRLECFNALEHAHGYAFTGQQSGCKKSSGGPANYGDVLIV